MYFNLPGCKETQSTKFNKCAPLRLLPHYSGPCVLEEVYMAAFVENLRYRPLLNFFPQATSPHQSQHSTVDVGQLHDPQTYTQHAIQVQHIQVTEPSPATQSSSQVFPSSLQEMLSLPACSAGILHVLMQGTVFSLSFKGPHVKWLSHWDHQAVAQMSPGAWGGFVVGLFGYLLCGFLMWGFFLPTVCTKEREMIGNRHICSLNEVCQLEDVNGNWHSSNIWSAALHAVG